MSSDPALCPDFLAEPYWWEAAPPRRRAMDIASRADVVVVGGGIAGLSTAIELARNGVGSAVLDREAIGWGASSRNGGALAGAVALRRAKAVDPAILEDMEAEAEQSFEDFEQLVLREELQCDYQRCGRFVAAHSPAAMLGLARQAELAGRLGGEAARLLPREAVEEELATERYFGGVVLPRAGTVHPGKYVQELARVAAAAGVALHGGVSVRRIDRNGIGFRVKTDAGDLGAGAVMIATNAYTGAATPWHRRRVVPVTSTMIATEALSAERVRGLLRNLRAYGDTKRLAYYFRPSPDGQRILFGGRVRGGDLRTGAKTLRGFLLRLFPSLADVRVSHAWNGGVAFAFDHLPHVGERDGVHHALACNGGGVVMMTHLGRQAARQIIGRSNKPSAFARLPFPTMPGYTGWPWFMPAIIESYRLRDRMEGWP